MYTKAFFDGIGQEPVAEISDDLIGRWKEWARGQKDAPEWYNRPSWWVLKIIETDDREKIESELKRELNKYGLLLCGDCGKVKPRGFWGPCLHCVKPEPEKILTARYQEAAAWLEIHEPEFDRAVLDAWIENEGDGCYSWIEGAEDDADLGKIAKQVRTVERHFGKVLWRF
jgi:hypothetical protein